MASLVVTAHCNTSVSKGISVFAAWSTVTNRPIVSVVLAVARSKFGQRQYLLTQFTVLLLLQMLFLTYSLTTT